MGGNTALVSWWDLPAIKHHRALLSFGWEVRLEETVLGVTGMYTICFMETVQACPPHPMLISEHGQGCTSMHQLWVFPTGHLKSHPHSQNPGLPGHVRSFVLVFTSPSNSLGFFFNNSRSFLESMCLPFLCRPLLSYLNFSSGPFVVSWPSKTSAWHVRCKILFWKAFCMYTKRLPHCLFPFFFFWLPQV